MLPWVDYRNSSILILEAFRASGVGISALRVEGVGFGNFRKLGVPLKGSDEKGTIRVPLKVSIRV